MASIMSSLIEKIKEQQNVINALKTTYRAELQKELNVMVREFFDATPEIETVHWTQYTPFWNDGEECVFSVNEICYSPRGTDRGDIDFYDNYDIKLVDSKTLEEAKAEYAEVENARSGPYHKDDPFFNKYKYQLFDYKYNYSLHSDIHSDNISVSKRSAYLQELEQTIKFGEQAIQENWNVDRALKNFEEFSNFINSIDGETMQYVFGDHVSVILSRSGIDTQEYEHE